MKNSLMRVVIFAIFFGLILGTACNKESRTEDQIIADFIEDNNLQGEFVEDGLFVAIENPGNGEQPTIDDTVEVFYEGKYASDGKVFDGNLNGNAIFFPLNAVIRGWQKGIPYFGVGEKGWLIIPAEQAYGSSPPNGIRKDATLAFYIELISIK